MNLEERLRSKIGHMLQVNYSDQRDSSPKDITGILKEVTTDALIFKYYTSFGEEVEFTLNRKHSIFISMADYTNGRKIEVK